MAHKHKNRKTKRAYSKDHARDKTTKRHAASGWESEVEGYVSAGRRRPTRRGGRGCPTCG